ncbi:MAG: NAD-dependent epimerase/dehydratase family protein [Gammaproteobacteria bacterium]|nr:NAD-dependent epimerase/dehydratase family protein [Gammaproteobacteria bacterium]
MKYFVTGATGFVGGYLVRELRAAGHEVRCLVRDPNNASELARLGVSLHRGDVTDKASMREPMSGVDGVFHVAAWYKIGVRDQSPAAPTNIGGTRNVLELMRELSIPKGVYTSTLAVNSDTHGQLVNESYHFKGVHLTEYDRTKSEAHQLAEKMISEGLPLVIVMPGLIYGPGDTSTVRTMLLQFMKRLLPMVPRETAFSWAHVEDIARTHLLAMETARVGEKYIICGPTHTLAEGFKVAAGLLGRRAPFAAPSGLFRTMVAPMRLIERFIPVPATYSSDAMQVSGGVTHIGDNAKARAELGYAPRALSIGLAETLAHEKRLLGKAS